MQNYVIWHGLSVSVQKQAWMKCKEASCSFVFVFFVDLIRCIWPTLSWTLPFAEHATGINTVRWGGCSQFHWKSFRLNMWWMIKHLLNNLHLTHTHTRDTHIMSWINICPERLWFWYKQWITRRLAPQCKDTKTPLPLRWKLHFDSFSEKTVPPLSDP